jgi:tetratricopeptide (TPR) repeat protein
MLKTRIRNWKLDKKLKFTDMRTAIQLVAAGGFEGPGTEPRFLIRGRMVPYSEVLRYFHRKGIPDPLNWLRNLPDDNFIPSSDVELHTPHSTDCTPDSTDEEGSSVTRSPAEALQPLDVETSQELQRPPMEHTAQPTPEPNEAEGLDTMHISYPLQPYLPIGAEKVVHVANNYCAMYLNSGRSLGHTEPSVHHLTTHAIFAQRMQDGISLLLRNDTASAFYDFQRAFALVKDLLRDNHPMSIGLLLSIVCDLDSRNLGALIFHLFRHIEEMASVELGTFDPLTTLFRTFTHVEGDATNLALLVIRRAADHLTEFDGHIGWKSLYLRERLCDCLYYARYDYERASRRRALLRDQEEVYGLDARNVLWTLTNVADDCLQLGRCEEAKTSFGKVLRRSQTLSGYGKAKTRFAALEGLARCAMADARCTQAYDYFDVDETLRRQSKINEALRLFKEAEAEAEVWFDPSSRRIARVRASILEVEALT